MESSLWLYPRKNPVKVDLRKRFGHYPYFVYSFGQYVDLEVPNQVPVVWRPIGKFLETIDTWNEDETQATTSWIRQVESMMRSGEDVPPLLVDGKRLFDGRHRGWAAHSLGIKMAPVVDISPYWKPKQK